MTFFVLLIRRNKSDAVTVLVLQGHVKLQQKRTAFQIPLRFQVNNYALDAIKGMRYGDASGNAV